MDAFLAECASAGSAELAVFPELFLSGYNSPGNRFMALEPGWENSHDVRTIVSRHGLHVCLGVAEKVAG